MKLLAVALLVSACSAPNTPSFCDAGFMIPAVALGPGRDQVPVAGRAVTMSLGLYGPAFDCDGKVRRAHSDSVVTDVRDALNRAVVHVATQPSIDKAGAVRTDVNFTPVTAGLYHLSARFEPQVGQAQMGLFVAADRSAAPVMAITLESTCSALDRLPSGLILCLKADGHLEIYRQSIRIKTLDADQFATAGPVLWTIHNGVLRRWLEDGTDGVRQSPEQDVPTAVPTAGALQGSLALVAREDEVLVTSPTMAVRVHLVGEAWVIDLPLRFHSGQFIVVHVDTQWQNVMFAGDLNFCRASLIGDPQVSCVRWPSLPLGSDNTGLWAGCPEGICHHAFTAGPSGMIKTTILDTQRTPYSQTTSSHFPGVPAATVFNDVRKLVLRLTSDGIILEDYGLPEGFKLCASTPETVRAEDSSGRQLLFAR